MLSKTVDDSSSVTTPGHIESTNNSNDVVVDFSTLYTAPTLTPVHTPYNSDATSDNFIRFSYAEM